MSTKLQAVLPAAIRRRWDRIALVQLAERAAELAAENAELRERCARAEECADHWAEQAQELAGPEAGLTVGGRFVRLAG
jgi:hypothetical protein